MAAQNYANNYATTLNGAIDNSQTTLTLTSATGAPTAPFVILIDSELMLVGARTTTACSSITRGYDGTSAASHSDLATITHVLSAASLLAVLAQNKAAAYASLAAAYDGALKLPTDGAALYRDSGSALVPYGPLWPLTQPPLTADWTAISSAAIADFGGAARILAPAASGNHLKLAVKAAPATPYTILALILPSFGDGGSPSVGLCWRQSSDGKLVVLRVQWTAATPIVDKWTDPDTFSAAYFTGTAGRGTGPYWVQISDNGAAGGRKAYIGHDPNTMIQIDAQDHTNFMTPDQVGFFANANNATYGCGALLLSWKVT